MASAPLAVPLVGVREATALGGGIEVELSALNNPDEIRATISSGRVDVATMPLQTAALLANGGLEISLLVVINANLLKVLGPGTDAWQGLQGQTIHLPFRGDAADLLFRVLAADHGLVADQDFTVEYATALPDLVAALAQGPGRPRGPARAHGHRGPPATTRSAGGPRPRRPVARQHP